MALIIKVASISFGFLEEQLEWTWCLLSYALACWSMASLGVLAD